MRFPEEDEWWFLKLREIAEEIDAEVELRQARLQKRILQSLEKIQSGPVKAKALALKVKSRPEQTP